MKKRTYLKNSILIPIISGALIASGGIAFAKQPRGGHRQSPAPVGVSKSNVAHVYKPSAPHFVTRSNVPHHAAGKFPSKVTRSRGAEFDQQQRSTIKSRQHVERSPGQTGKWSHSDHAGKSKLDSQTAKQLRDWRGKPNSVAEAREKHREHRKHHHDHDWWRHHCDVIVLVGWGYWGWDAGWWYPAWGYDPNYSFYEYDGPIYSYDGIPPDQIIANVQGALQRLGYYRYAVDGLLGPLTQAALKNYQRDRGLAITGAIDPQTLTSLGFIA